MCTHPPCTRAPCAWASPGSVVTPVPVPERRSKKPREESALVEQLTTQGAPGSCRAGTGAAARQLPARSGQLPGSCPAGAGQVPGRCRAGFTMLRLTQHGKEWPDVASKLYHVAFNATWQRRLLTLGKSQLLSKYDYFGQIPGSGL